MGSKSGGHYWVHSESQIKLRNEFSTPAKVPVLQATSSYFSTPALSLIPQTPPHLQNKLRLGCRL